MKGFHIRNVLMTRALRLAIVLHVAISGCATTALAQFSAQQSFTAQNNTIIPFGYGTVAQYLTNSSGVTGNAVCAGTPTPTCLSISGQGDCTWQTGQGTMISCNTGGKTGGSRTITQYVTTSSGATGNAVCAATLTPTCLSISGQGDCTWQTGSGTVVSCTNGSTTGVDETAFSPVNCNGNLNGDGGVSGLITASDWCGWQSYMANRTIDTVYQYNDYVRLGVNRRFGGTVFELYGTDKLDRIQQNPGGALQLALYGDDLNYAPAGTPSGWFATNLNPNFLPPNPQGWDNTAFTTQATCNAAHPGATCTLRMAADNVSDDVTNVGCANNGADAGAGFNPVQAVSQNCWYGNVDNYVDDTYSPALGTLTVDKHAPANYSKSSSVSGLFWAQSSQVIGPFAQLTYDIQGGTAMRTMTPDFQELPAIFLHEGIGAQVYFYTGSSPYNSITAPVSMVTLATGTTGILGFPTRSGQYGAGYDIAMTEDWASMCDTTGTKCVTIASFSNDAQIIQASNNTTGSYIGIHGFFTLKPGLNTRTTLFVAPYRFDDIVGGQSVRQWVYQLKQNPLLPAAPVHSPNN